MSFSCIDDEHENLSVGCCINHVCLHETRFGVTSGRARPYLSLWSRGIFMIPPAWQNVKDFISHVYTILAGFETLVGCWVWTCSLISFESVHHYAQLSRERKMSCFSRTNWHQRASYVRLIVVNFDLNQGWVPPTLCVLFGVRVCTCVYNFDRVWNPRRVLSLDL